MSEDRAAKARRIQEAARAGESTIVASLTPAPTVPAAAPPPAAPRQSGQEQRTPAPPKEPTVRFTIDLDRNSHRRLKLLALENDVRAADVIRSMLAGLDDDQVAALINQRQAAG